MNSKQLKDFAAHYMAAQMSDIEFLSALQVPPKLAEALTAVTKLPAETASMIKLDDLARDFALNTLTSMTQSPVELELLAYRQRRSNDGKYREYARRLYEYMGFEDDEDFEDEGAVVYVRDCRVKAHRFVKGSSALMLQLTFTGQHVATRMCAELTAYCKTRDLVRTQAMISVDDCVVETPYHLLYDLDLLPPAQIIEVRQ